MERFLCGLGRVHEVSENILLNFWLFVKFPRVSCLTQIEFSFPERKYNSPELIEAENILTR